LENSVSEQERILFSLTPSLVFDLLAVSPAVVTSYPVEARGRQGVHGAMAKAIGWGLPPRVQILGAALYSGFIPRFSGAMH